MHLAMRHAPRGPWLKLATGCLLLLCTTGCLSSKGFWRKVMKNSGTFTMSGMYQAQGLKPPLVLVEAQIKSTATDTETNGTTRVSYGEGLQPQAALVADSFEQALLQTGKTLGAPLPMRPHVYLLRLPGESRVIRFSLSGSGLQKTLPWVVVLTNAPPETGSVTSGTPALWADLHELSVQVFLVSHEACEIHLVDPPEFLVMGDVDGGQGFIHINLKYHTRWFRDGLANYTGYKASQNLRSRLTDAGVDPGPLHFCENSMRPFSRLAKVKGKLFDWNQNSPSSLDAVNYEAAMALFLLIEQHNGPEAVTGIVQELPRVRFPDGKSLLRMVRQKTGLDLHQLSETFEFPDLGIESHPDALGRPEVEKIAGDSWAARADLLVGDVILEANACSLAGLIDFELQVLKALNHGAKLSLTVSRNGQRFVTDPLDLPHSPALN